MRLRFGLIIIIVAVTIAAVLTGLPQQTALAGCSTGKPCVPVSVIKPTFTGQNKKKKPTKTETYVPRTRTPTFTETPIATDTPVPTATSQIVPVTGGDSNGPGTAPGGAPLPWLLGGGLGLLAGILIGLLVPAVLKRFQPPADFDRPPR